MESGSSRVARFGVFEVDFDGHELRKRGVTVRLQDQPFRVLEALLEKPGEVVTREQLKERLWAEDEFVEFDKSLNTAVQKIRQALGDSAESPRFLETVPRRGYRFVAPVERPVSLDATRPPRGRRPLWLKIGAAVAVGTALFVTSRPFSKDRSEPTRQPVLDQLTFDTGLTTAPAVSPDGALLAYASDRSGGGNLDIWVQKLPSGEPVRLTSDPAEDTEPHFSPDSGTIVFSSAREGGGIYTIPALGGKITRVAGKGVRPRFSPDGSVVLYSAGFYDATDKREVEIVSLRGTGSRPVAPGIAPIWGPDGASVISSVNSEGGDWVLTDLETGESVPLKIAEFLRSSGLSPSAYSGNWFRPSLLDRQTHEVLFPARLNDGLNVWRIGLDRDR